jgi:hypothetical protein
MKEQKLGKTTLNILKNILARGERGTLISDIIELHIGAKASTRIRSFSLLVQIWKYGII